METTFVKYVLITRFTYTQIYGHTREDTPVDAHDIEADIAAFVKYYKGRNISGVFSSCDHG